MKPYYLHLGVFTALLAVAFGATRFLGAPTDTLRAVPFLYFVYLAVWFLVQALRKKQRRKP